jgi:molybdopterin converting factor small subunit
MNVRFYGRLADLLGDQLRLDLPAEGCPVAELRRLIADAHPAAAAAMLGPGVRAIVGDDVVGDGHMVEGSGTVEFFPPVSGG